MYVYIQIQMLRSLAPYWNPCNVSGLGFQLCARGGGEISARHVVVAVRRRRLARCWLYQCDYVYVEGGAPPSCVYWFTHPIYHGAIHASLPMNQFSYLWGTSLQNACIHACSQTDSQAGRQTDIACHRQQYMSPFVTQPMPIDRESSQDFLDLSQSTEAIKLMGPGIMISLPFR